jgi:hypothetical protein
MIVTDNSLLHQKICAKLQSRSFKVVCIAAEVGTLLGGLSFSSLYVTTASRGRNSLAPDIRIYCGKYIKAVRDYNHDLLMFLYVCFVEIVENMLEFIKNTSHARGDMLGLTLPRPLEMEFMLGCCA